MSAGRKVVLNDVMILLGDGLRCLFRQLPNSACHTLAQLQLAQELAHAPQLLASLTASGRT